MIVSGLWHGAAWTFVLWGAVHAFFSSIEKITKWPQKLSNNRFSRTIAWLIVSLQVLVAWVFFRAENINQAFDIIKTMFAFNGSFSFGWGLNETIFILIIAIRETFVALKIKTPKALTRPVGKMIFYALLIVCIIFFRGPGSEFIYFQF